MSLPNKQLPHKTVILNALEAADVELEKVQTQIMDKLDELTLKGVPYQELDPWLKERIHQIGYVRRKLNDVVHAVIKLEIL
jgi:hypothetical protein